MLSSFALQAQAEGGKKHYRMAKVTGIDMIYREAGIGNNSTVVLLYGFPSSPHMFRNLIPSLMNPDAWVHAQSILDKPGAHPIQLELRIEAKTNGAEYPELQEYFEGISRKLSSFGESVTPSLVSMAPRLTNKI